MHLPLHSSKILAGLLAGCLLSVPALARDIEKTFDAKAGDELYLRTDSGSIEINTHSSNTIEVMATVEGKNEDDFTITFDESSKGLKIRGEREGNWGWSNLKVHFMVTVPKEYDLRLDTAGGRIRIDDLVGNIDARTSGGSIFVGKVKGDVELKTSGGSIRTEDVYGEIDAHTSGGSIEVTFAKQPEKDASLSTSGGSITANLPQDIKIDLEASTSGGRVKTEFDVDGSVKKQSIRGSINGGGPSLELHTSGGSIRVNKI